MSAVLFQRKTTQPCCRCEMCCLSVDASYHNVFSGYSFAPGAVPRRPHQRSQKKDLIDGSTHWGLNKNVCSRSPLLQESAGCVSSRFQFSALSLISHSGISSSSTVCYCKAAVAPSAVSTCACAWITVCSRLGRVLVYLLQHLSLSLSLRDCVSFH